MTSTTAIYRSGNSKVLTIPGWVGLEIGDEVKLWKDKHNLIIEKINKKKANANNAHKLRQKLGQYPGVTQGLNPQAIDEYLEDIYE